MLLEDNANVQFRCEWVFRDLTCCVSIQSLHPSEAAFEGQLHHHAAGRLFQFEGPSKCGLLFPLFGGCTATNLRRLTYPKILCMLKKNGDIAWRSSSLSQAWAAEISRPSHLTMVYVVNKGGYFLYHLWQIVGMVRWLVHMHNILRMIEMSEKKTLGNRRTWAFVNLRKRLCMHVSSVHRFIYLNILVCRAVDILFWIHKKYIKIVCIEWYHVLK